MSIALTVYFSNAASSTLSTANQLYTTSGTPSSNATYSRVGTATGWGEITSQGTTSAWAAGGSIGAPTGKGFLNDVTTLEGQLLLGGTWTSVIRLNCAQGGSSAPQAGNLTADLVVRAYKYNAGTYTAITSMTLTAQSLTAAFTSYSLSVSSVGNTVFSSGDKLYIDMWSNVTTNTNGSSIQDIRLNRLSTDTTTFTGDTAAEVVTAGYSPIVSKDLKGRFRLSVTSLKDIASRFRQQATSTRDLTARFVLSANQRTRDITGRVRLLSSQTRDLSARMRLQITRARDLSARLRMIATPLKDSALRIRVLSSALRDLRSRVRLQVTWLKDARGRLVLVAVGARDLSVRLILVAPPIVLPPPGVFAYTGIPACLPIPVPGASYLFGGVILDTPLLCTAPPLIGGQLLAGSIFTLLFQSPSTSTQNALSLGSAGSMQLALADSSAITAPVVVSGNTQVGTLLQVLFTVQVSTPFWSYVTVTPFF